jgi:hypothetical protein
MPEPPPARLCHSSAGRLRLRVDAHKRDDRFFAEAKRQIETWPGVRRVEVNPLTGSVLILFEESAAAPGEIERRARESGLFAVESSAAERKRMPPAEAAVERVRRLDERLREWTGGAGDLRSVVFLSLIAAGAFQLMRGKVAAPAVTLFWYAAEAAGLSWKGPASSPVTAGPTDLPRDDARDRAG